MATLVRRENWKLVPQPAHQQIIQCKWVFKTKWHVDRSIDKLKARLVAMGFSQVQGIDYNEVFSPTTRQEWFRLLVTVMAHRGWKGRQVDFKAAFLNGTVKEELYMSQPEGFEDQDHPDWVCKIIHSIYGLKQSP